MSRLMTLLRCLLLLAATSMTQSPAMAADYNINDILNNTLNGYVRPAHDRLEQGAAALETASAKLCGEPSAQALDNARSAFGDVVLAWSRIEFFRLGPVLSENRAERVLFYPDRRSTGLKQVQKAIASRREDVSDPAKLAGMSVAMQGLGAYEYLLFGKGYKALLSGEDAFRCKYAHAIASNIHTIAKELKAGWQEGARAVETLLKPGPQNPQFHNDREALGFIIGVLVNGSETIKDVRVGSFFSDKGKDRPRVAIYRRSGLTLASIAANSEGLAELYEKSGIARVLPPESGLETKIPFEWQQIIDAASALDQGVEKMLKDEKSRNKLSYLKLQLGYVIEDMNTGIAAGAGLSAGFSFGDGD